MGSIIVALPKLEDAKRISEMLKQRGLQTAAVCTSASKVLSTVHQLDNGVVICGRRLPDMHYTQLAEYLPEYFEMLLISSKSVLEDCPDGVTTLGIPFRVSDLTGIVETILSEQTKALKKKKSAPKKRSEKEQNYINNAKWVLMEKNRMTETEAFRYIQKCSMDSGSNMVETAQKILLLMYENEQP